MSLGTTLFFTTDGGNMPALDYITAQDPHAQAALLAAIQTLAREFPNVQTVSIKPIKGKIWEIRVQDQRGVAHRVLYVVVRDTLVILHAFTKRTPKTPKNELETAEKRLKKMAARE